MNEWEIQSHDGQSGRLIHVWREKGDVIFSDFVLTSVWSPAMVSYRILCVLRIEFAYIFRQDMDFVFDNNERIRICIYGFLWATHLTECNEWNQREGKSSHNSNKWLSGNGVRATNSQTYKICPVPGCSNNNDARLQRLYSNYLFLCVCALSVRSLFFF